MPTITVEIDTLRQMITEAVTTAMKAELRSKEIAAPPGSYMARRAQALEEAEKKRNKKLRKAA